MSIIMPKQKESGFTIVELIMVIVVLGVLATFALPRFPQWNSKAREAAVNGLEGSMYSSAALAHATQLANGVSAAANISMDGVVIPMIYEYPTSAGVSFVLRNYKGFTLSNPGTTAVFKYATATNPAACYVAYGQASGLGFAPTISSEITGC